MALNVNNLDTDRTLDRAIVLKEVVEVIHALLEDSGYSKEDAAEDLYKFLEKYGYLHEISQYKGDK